ncbi:MAG: hypothetical protein HYS22_05780 [Deltaproteobacteria bacterium]|nr:hypothetical protein [Deltaproteobacteria bacterium]
MKEVLHTAPLDPPPPRGQKSDSFRDHYIVFKDLPGTVPGPDEKDSYLLYERTWYEAKDRSTSTAGSRLVRRLNFDETVSFLLNRSKVAADAWDDKAILPVPYRCSVEQPHLTEENFSSIGSNGRLYGVREFNRFVRIASISLSVAGVPLDQRYHFYRKVEEAVSDLKQREHSYPGPVFYHGKLDRQTTGLVLGAMRQAKKNLQAALQSPTTDLELKERLQKYIASIDSILDDLNGREEIYFFLPDRFHEKPKEDSFSFFKRSADYGTLSRFTLATSFNGEVERVLRSLALRGSIVVDASTPETEKGFLARATGLNPDLIHPSSSVDTTPYAFSFSPLMEFNGYRVPIPSEVTLWKIISGLRSAGLTKKRPVPKGESHNGVSPKAFQPIGLAEVAGEKIPVLVDPQEPRLHSEEGFGNRLVSFTQETLGRYPPGLIAQVGKEASQPTVNFVTRETFWNVYYNHAVDLLESGESLLREGKFQEARERITEAYRSFERIAAGDLFGFILDNSRIYLVWDEQYVAPLRHEYAHAIWGSLIRNKVVDETSFKAASQAVGALWQKESGRDPKAIGGSLFDDVEKGGLEWLTDALSALFSPYRQEPEYYYTSNEATFQALFGLFIVYDEGTQRYSLRSLSEPLGVPPFPLDSVTEVAQRRLDFLNAVPPKDTE